MRAFRYTVTLVFMFRSSPRKRSPLSVFDFDFDEALA